MWLVRNRTGIRTRALAWSSRLVPAGRSAVREALDLITPWNSGLPLIRVGGDADGGYLIPDALEGIEALFSPGVSSTWDFERFVADKYGIRSFMVDGSVDAPAGLTEFQQFRRIWLGTRSSGDVITLDDWISDSVLSESADLLLQMDIEGSEYGVLNAVRLSTLRRFRIVVVEYHGLDWMSVAPVLSMRILPAFRKMSVDFEAVHVHPNNCCGAQNIYGVPIPKVLEVTYLRRDWVFGTPVRARIPHALDRDCVVGNPPLSLPALWPRV